jgi:hypothetical protein
VQGEEKRGSRDEDEVSQRTSGQTSPTAGRRRTLAPVAVRTANEKSFDGFGAPSILNWEKAAACPSIGCETFPGALQERQQK